MQLLFNNDLGTRSLYLFLPISQSDSSELSFKSSFELKLSGDYVFMKESLNT
jgi:hypothetical protein